MAQILITDDIQSNIQLLSFDLEDDGHSILEATSGHACVQLAIKERPDIILLDIVMPGWSGIETLQVLKKTPQTAKIPVIMVSGNDDEDSLVEALDLGAHDYVTKPVVYPVLAARLRSALRLQEIQAELELLATVDALTGAYNRRQFWKVAEAELSRSRRFKRDFSIIMLDADHFKGINDNHGHGMGDKALKAMARICQEQCRESDAVGRIGGEEFVICCPDTDTQGACILAERIRSEIEAHEVVLGQRRIHFTVSQGISSLQAHHKDFDALLEEADKGLYEAKEKGRNCVVCSEAEPLPQTGTP